MKVSHYFEDADNVEVNAAKLTDTRPWLVDAPQIDTTLTKQISKKDSPEALLAHAR